MKKEKQYRFKTETELKAEFGEDFRKGNTLNYGWVPQMDKLFGLPYTGILPTKTREGRVGCWSISPEMLTTHRLPKLLADDTIAKVNMKVIWGEGDKQLPGIIQKVYTDEGDGDYIEIRCCCSNCIRSNSKFFTLASLKSVRKG